FLLCTLGLPFVLHGRTESPGPIAWLDIDNHAVCERSTLHLLDAGHRRVALINGPRGFTFSAHREAGYRAALAARGIAPDPGLMAEGLFSDEIGFRLAQAMLAGAPRPTAFVAGSMMTALGVFRAIRAAGLELGRDVSMIAHDDVFPYLSAETMVPAMSTTRSSIRSAGGRIAELALEMLGGKPPDAIHELWPIDLVLRASTGPAPA
ncbi:MAG: transcriptional regulator, partial [Hyphomicrobiales bacterium]